VVSGQWSVVSDEWRICKEVRLRLRTKKGQRNKRERNAMRAKRSSGQWSVVSSQKLNSDIHHSSLIIHHSAFTLIELLVTISIIGILSALVMAAMSGARQTAREAATKATIAKLHTIIMQRYELYKNRRLSLPPLVYPVGNPKAGQPLSPNDAAKDRLYAIRDLMRMEMPDRLKDIPTDGTDTGSYDPPIPLPYSGQRVRIPALGLLYHSLLTSKPPTGSGQNGSAELLYLIVSMGSPEAMEQFNPSEIGDTDSNGYLEFLDGWGHPISFLRWAPGFSQYSDIQVADPVNRHDPFDPRRMEDIAYHLIPLIYSSGANGEPGLSLQNDFSQNGYHFGDTNNPGSMFYNKNGSQNTVFLSIGSPFNNGTDYQDNITNHHIEAR